MYVVLEYLSSLPAHRSVYLSYAGITVSSFPSGSIVNDLTAEATSSFASFACHLVRARHDSGQAPARWQIWRLKTTVPCTSLQLRGRFDLQMAERVAIRAIGLSLNSAPWCAPDGGFTDTFVLVHLLIWLAILYLIGYFRRIRPFSIRVQSAKVSQLAVNSLVTVNVRFQISSSVVSRQYHPNDAESLTYCQCFSERRNINIAALSACISPLWIRKRWADTIPPDWVIWIGVIAVCPTGPGDRVRHRHRSRECTDQRS